MPCLFTAVVMELLCCVHMAPLRTDICLREPSFGPWTFPNKVLSEIKNLVRFCKLDHFPLFSFSEHHKQNSPPAQISEPHENQMISLRPFLCYLVWVTFHQSSLDQPLYASADYKVRGPLNLSGCWCSSNYSASTMPCRLEHCDHSNWFCISSHLFCPLSRAVGLNHARKMHPTPIFCLLRTEWRMTVEVFPSLCRGPHSAILYHFTWKKKIAVY